MVQKIAGLKYYEILSALPNPYADDTSNIKVQLPSSEILYFVKHVVIVHGVSHFYWRLSNLERLSGFDNSVFDVVMKTELELFLKNKTKKVEEENKLKEGLKNQSSEESFFSWMQDIDKLREMLKREEFPSEQFLEDLVKRSPSNLNKQ